MILSPGEKLHVITRRQFETDLRRHFVGEIEAVAENTVRLNGYAFIFDATRNEYSKRPELRTKIVALNDSANVITLIPKEVDLSALRYEISASKRLVVTDARAFSLDINEFGVGR